MIDAEKVKVTELGPRVVRSPLRLTTSGGGRFVPDAARMPVQVEVLPGRERDDSVWFEKAGPREMIFFDPARTRAAIVTCGGLCPGLNNVIRSIVLQLYHGYGAKDVIGIRYGYRGMDPANEHEPIALTPAAVTDIHKQGGTILGSSRGPVDPAIQAGFLRQHNVQILFCIGGDGTQRGAHQIHLEAQRQGYPLAVVGVPKTIDNDINYVWRTFGYGTALDKSREVIDSAHNEARGALNGIGLVKLMGREAGFIAAGATLASQEVNFTLIPEIPFDLEGEKGFLNVLRERLLERAHAVVVVAEGAGQQLIPSDSAGRDASGNVKFNDIGAFLCDRIRDYFARLELPISLKYFDPSYHIRSVEANCEDSLLCDQLARSAVHAAMAGKTDILIGLWYNVMTHVPIPLAIETKKRIGPENDIWRAVLQVTGQPARFGD